MSDPPPEILGPAPAGEQDTKWERKAEELEFEALSKVRGAAEKWAATIGVLLGLIGTVLLVKGPDEIAKLPDGAQWLIGILLAFAFGLAVAATVLAAFAAQGTPQTLEQPSGTTLRRSEKEATAAARERLSWSRRLTLVTVFLLAGAVAAAWIWPESEGASSSSSVVFTPAHGKPLCGALVNLGDGLAIEVGEARTPLPEGPYDNVVPVGSCPSK